MSPFFGAQNGQQGAGPPTVQLPAGMPLLVAASLGRIPANLLVATVNGVGVGAGDGTSLAELTSNGNGDSTMRGTPAPPSGGINDQVFVGNLSAVAMSANGPTAVNNTAQPLAPVSQAVTCNNITLAGNAGGGAMG